MAAEEVLNLFDSYWFEHAIFSSISSSQSQEIIKANLSLQIPEEIQEPEFSRLPIMHGSSKSLSDLEFDELKGFMDLGFVFTEEDNKDSELVSIIPGLGCFGLSKKKREAIDDDELEENSLGNEIDMKDHLRLWAHSVASSVR
ncbi:hypothetical protein FEM48_Zijuj04G0105200 [Ziziphus jujuba var. spinosa]|uniref:Uncharacterized protein n=1 Tax=Ziziphus jujuba var. spinosa TaxID=714518 RepID=A0A978VJD4_ZIZJJ|nr:hypothetical protein FEM48_Zijuj04G0105200 [Ziziphus jujuba var. spinosa]